MKILLFIQLLVSIALFSHAQDVNGMISKGNKYYKQTQYNLAEAAYRQALQVQPNHSIAQFNLANALQKQKNYEGAAKVLEQLYTTTSDNKIKSAAAYNQGVAFTKQKELEASIEAYKKALRIDPTDQQARENLQKALSELKQKKEQDQKKQQKSSSSMSQKEAEQKLKLLQEKEKQLQQRLQNQSKQQGGGQAKDW
jgi:Ca-activated chloride channel family protein